MRSDKEFWSSREAHRKEMARRRVWSAVGLVLLEALCAAVGLAFVWAVTPSPAQWGQRIGLYLLWLLGACPIAYWWARGRSR